jgi:ferredoxin/flavodoxin
MNQSPLYRSARVVYFSGTGCTALVARVLREAFVRHGVEAASHELRAGVPDPEGSPDLLVVVYAVHACNAPEPVYEWIGRLPDGRRADGSPSPVVVLSNSGGGEVWPNLACRVGVISRLAKRGYRTVHDQMLVMPSNWIVASKPPLAARLLEILPERCDQVVARVLAGRERHSRPGWIDRLTSACGEAEKIGAHEFGKRIRVSAACNACGLCARQCPAANITMNGSRPVFGKKCLLCLKCFYACPTQALSPGFAKFILVPSGFNLKDIESSLPWPEAVDVEREAAGWVWSGVRKYLLETPD